MALPGMDLQSQYNQTLQNTIGQSQAERLRQTRQQQSIANTDWQQRGVADGAKRMAGFQEVNPSEMPNMSSETRSFIEPLLGAYQEGGKQVEGYYGKDNPYTQGGLESLLGKQGYAHAPSSLSEQFKSVGLKLPNAYGQDYYNASHEDVGNKINAYYQEQEAKQLEPWQRYEQAGFIPGKNVDNWKWLSASEEASQNYDRSAYREQPFGNTLTARPDFNSMYGPNEGRWVDNAVSTIFYDPKTKSYDMQSYPDNVSGFNKIFPSLVLTGLGSIFGGAGGLIGGGLGTVGGAVGSGIGAALPSIAQTGMTTGDWGKALENGGLSALGGSLGNVYGGDLAKVFNAPASGGKGLISLVVNTLGNTALGNKVDYKNSLASTLSNIASPYLGNLTTNVVGGSAGDILGGAVGGFSGNALKNILQGKSLDIGTALSTLQGATGGLGRLFSNTNEDKQSVNGPTSLAKTRQGVKNGPTATFRRT